MAQWPTKCSTCQAVQSLDVAAQMHKLVCDDKHERLRLWDPSRSHNNRARVAPLLESLSLYLRELQMTPPRRVASDVVDVPNRALRLRRGVVANPNGRYRVGTAVANMLAQLGILATHMEVFEVFFTLEGTQSAQELELIYLLARQSYNGADGIQTK